MKKRSKPKFSPKLQPSTLDDIRKFVPKPTKALTPTVIPEYSELQSDYKGYSFPGGLGVNKRFNFPKGNLSITPGADVVTSPEFSVEPNLNITYSPTRNLEFYIDPESPDKTNDVSMKLFNKASVTLINPIGLDTASDNLA